MNNDNTQRLSSQSTIPQVHVAAKPTTASPPAPAKFKELDFAEKKMEAIVLVKMEENTI